MTLSPLNDPNRGLQGLLGVGGMGDGLIQRAQGASCGCREEETLSGALQGLLVRKGLSGASRVI